MQLPTQLTTVTKLSKTLALGLFIALPFIGFCLGKKYATTTNAQVPINTSNLTCTPTWKTFEHKELGLTFKYPPTLKLDYYPKNDVYELHAVLVSIKTIEEIAATTKNYDELFGGSLIVYPNPDNISLQEHIEKVACAQARDPQNCIDNFDATKSDYKTGTITGIRGIVNLYENPTDDLLFLHANNIYVFRISGTTGAGSGPTEANTQLRDQILATFKF